MESCCVYIVFSSTPYKIGKMIRRITGEEFNHVSIALDENLSQMYGFARRYYRTPFYGGFVRESRSRYHVGETAAQIRICRLPVTQEQYRTLEQMLSQMHQGQEQYLYNHLSAAAALLRRRVKARDAYTCIEFCVHILHELGIDIDPGKYYSVGELEQLLHPLAIYSGPMPLPEEYDSAYYAQKPLPHPSLTSALAFLALFKRLQI